MSQEEEFSPLFQLICSGLKKAEDLLEGIRTDTYNALPWAVTAEELEKYLAVYFRRPNVATSSKGSPMSVSSAEPPKTDEVSSEESLEVKRAQVKEPPLGVPRRLNHERQEKVSKRLSVCLRHKRGEFGLRFDERAMMTLDNLLQLPIIYKPGISRDEIISAVHFNVKKRFRIAMVAGERKIGATKAIVLRWIWTKHVCAVASL